MPALGMAQETGRLVRWLKREGEQVAKGEPLMEVETDKATVEVEAPAAGTIAAVTAAEGDEIEVGRAIALILGPGESVPSAPAAAAPTNAPEPRPSRSSVPTAPSPPVSEAGERPAASPKARRLAAERGIDIAGLTGSGPGGAVLEADILQAERKDVPAESAIWRAMAANVSRSWREAPHFFVIREVDASALVQARERGDDRITFTDLVVRAVAAALTTHPRVNGSRPDVNVGLAVALPEGLIVPVIHDADRLDLTEIATHRRRLLDDVKAGRLRSSDLSGGTFTLSNLGMYGVDLFTAILTEGQAAILAVGRVTERVVAHGGQPVVKPTMLLSLSCDHRQVDGARAAEFLQTLVGLLETNPWA